MIYTNKHNLPGFLVRALEYSDYSPVGIGVTTLIDSPRIRVLRKLNADRITVDVTDNHNLLIGSAVHKYIEQSGSQDIDGLIAEERFKTTVLGVVVSGQPDVVDGSVLWDIKTSKSSSIAYTNESWEKQTNVYRWILSMNGINVDTLKVLVVYKDFSEGEKKFKISNGYSYPDIPYGVVDIPVWGLADTQRYVESRVRAHSDADTLLPECTQYERWQTDEKYAVMDGSRKKACRLLSTHDEAKAWMDDNSWRLKRPHIEHRPEQWRRCERYCNVRAYCTQYQAFAHKASGR